MIASTAPNYAGARRFILANARLIERHLFSFHFEEAPAARVRSALHAFRHENGLFGFALEPDKRAAAPQPVDQSVALEVMDAIGADRAAFASVCDALHILSNDDGGLPFSHPSVEAAPRAAWWACPEHQPSSINPTGSILSILWRNGVEHPWMRDAEEACWRALRDISDDGPHSLQNAVAFLSSHPDQERSRPALDGLSERVRAATAFDPESPGYVFSPLTFAPDPASPAAAFFTDDEVRPHLDHLVERQEADGGWPINWPPLSAGVRSECRGIMTLRNLLTLRSWGRLR